MHRARERIEWIIAYLLALTSAASASLYGFLSAAGPYGIVKGAGLFGVAFVGCHGPAWVSKAKQRLGWPGALFATLATAVCLSNASGSATLRAERAKISASTDADRAELARLMSERAAMVFTPASEESVEAARAAVASAERVRTAECGNGDPKQRGPNCRQRETDEQTKRDALAAALANKALTDKATKRDADAAAVRARLNETDPAIDGDPQASTFSQLTGITVATSAALNAFWLSLAFEIGAMLAMLVAYSKSVTMVEAAPTETMPAEVVAIGSARRSGDVDRFAVARLHPVEGAVSAIADLYDQYRVWATAQQLRAVSRIKFAQALAGICETTGFEMAGGIIKGLQLIEGSPRRA